MEIVTIHKENMVCSFCLQTIAVGEEAFKFFNREIPKELKQGHYCIGSSGVLHFRHLLCQYKQAPRKMSFEEYVKKTKLDQEAHSIRKALDLKKKMEKDLGRKFSEDDTRKLLTGSY